MLLPRAPKLFRHVRDVLQHYAPSTPIGGDYTAVLRTQFLAAPRYCAAAPPTVFQGAALPGVTWRTAAVGRVALQEGRVACPCCTCC